MDASELSPFQGDLSEQDWAALDSFLGRLPEPVRLVLWADPAAGEGDAAASILGRRLAERFDNISLEELPRQGNHPYHPITGIMGVDDEGQRIDFRLRLIGLPAGYQINSLIGAIQAVSFRGQTLEAVTRIQLSRLATDVVLECFTAAENEGGVKMATLLANLAVFHEHIRTNIVMVNDFPDLIPKYSIYAVPHTIINNRHHLTGVFSEEKFLAHLARAAGRSRAADHD